MGAQPTDPLGSAPDDWDTDVVVERAVAQIVDVLVGGVLTVALMLGIVSLAIATTTESLIYLIYLPYFLVHFLYNVATEARWQGQTVGKRLLNVEVRSLSGGPPSTRQVVVRNLPALFWLGPISYLVALVAMVQDDDNRRIFDMLADAVVVRQE